MMTDTLKNPLLSFLSTRTGISTAILSSVITIAAPIATHVYTHKTAYDEGQKDYEVALREGTAEIDGKVISIMTEAEKDALEEKARIQGEADGYQAAQIEFTATLRGIYDQHSRDLSRLAGRQYSPVELDWRSGDVPASTGLRLDRIIAARESGNSESGLSDTGDRAKLAGGETINTSSPYP